jgi:hypothetical protein
MGLTNQHRGGTSIRGPGATAYPRARRWRFANQGCSKAHSASIELSGAMWHQVFGELYYVLFNILDV